MLSLSKYEGRVSVLPGALLARKRARRSNADA